MNIIQNVYTQVKNQWAQKKDNPQQQQIESDECEQYQQQIQRSTTEDIIIYQQENNLEQEIPFQQSNIFEYDQEDDFNKILMEESLEQMPNRVQKLEFKNLLTNETVVDDLICQNKECMELKKEDWDNIESKKKKLQDFPHYNVYYSLLKGIGENQRRKVWKILAKVDDLKEKYKVSYTDLADKFSVNLEQIKKDIDRTQALENEKYTQEQKSKMIRILNAYANFNKQVGYCQGMNCIVSALLRNVDLSFDEHLKSQGFEQIGQDVEEEVFWLFIFILEEKQWYEHFLEGFIGTFNALKDLKNSIQKRFPNVYSKLISICKELHGNDYQESDLEQIYQQFFYSYYPTLLIYNTTFKFSTLVLDLFFYQGKDTLDCIILKMIDICQEQIMSSDYQGLSQLFRTGMQKKCLEIMEQKKDQHNLENIPLNFYQVQRVKY